MIKPKITVTKKKGAVDIEAVIAKLKGKEDAFVTVGIQEDAGSYEDGPSVAEVALWNEYGTKTTPERSFFRSTFAEKQQKITQWRDEAIRNILLGKWTPEQALDAIGFRMSTAIQNKVKSNVPPPNALSTIESKKRRGVAIRTLIDSGLMLRSIKHKVYSR
jgi:hypothetical protein